MELTRKEILRKGIKSIRFTIGMANRHRADGHFDSYRNFKCFAYGHAQLLTELLGCETKQFMLISIIDNMTK